MATWRRVERLDETHTFTNTLEFTGAGDVVEVDTPLFRQLLTEAGYVEDAGVPA